MQNSAQLALTLALVALALVTPLVGWRGMRRLMAELAAGDPEARPRAYIWTMRVQWGVAALLFAWWWILGGDLARVGLVPGWSGWQWVAVGAGALLCVATTVQTVMLRDRPDQLEKVREQSGDIALIAPQGEREQRLFDGVSITAGVCEEFVYRGLMLGLLAEMIGLWPAALVSTLLFGAAHAYQGFGGIVRTALAGAVGVLLTIFSGSIFVAIVVHAVVDLTQGRLLSAAARCPDRQEPPLAA